MADMKDIEKLTRSYAAEASVLRQLLADLLAEIAVSKRRAMRPIRTAVERTANAKNALYAALKGAAELFVKPRSVVIDGVKVGFQKQIGTITWDDDEAVCKLIRKHIPEQADVLIVTTERPSRKAMANLPVADIKRIGATVTADSDSVVIKDTASDVEKLVEALLGDAQE